MSLAQVFCFLAALFGLCQSSSILIISGVPSHSHSIWCNKLAQLLVNAGHKVTILDTDPPRKDVANLTHYHLEGGYTWSGDLDIQLMSEQSSPAYATDLLADWSIPICKHFMSSSNFKKFLDDHSAKSKPFDLIIHDITNCENFLGLVHALGYPKLMFVTAFGENNNALYLMNNQQNLFHGPLHMSPYMHPMTFLEKLENFYYSVYHYYVYHSYVNTLDSFSKEAFGNSTPHVFEIAKRSAVLLVNGHPILDGAKYYSPAVVQVGGFHIDQPKKLDKEIQAFLDGAEHGAIYFSLGSNLQSTMLSKDRIQMFLNVFQKLKQRILWKFEGTSLTNLPKNVMISKWLSQNEILAHPNMKLFISHSGLLSTQEAIYHGVPMIVMPFIIDQHFLSAKLVRQGLAEPLPYANLSEANIRGAIYRILTNDSYKKEMERWSKVFKDRPVPPKDLALHWVEFVLRNDDFKLLQPPEALTSARELLLLDFKTIFGFIAGVLFCMAARTWFGDSSKSRKNKKFKRS